MTAREAGAYPQVKRRAPGPERGREGLYRTMQQPVVKGAPSRLEDATERLHAAVDRLERAVENREKAGAGGPDDDEVDSLRSALQAAETENAELRRTTDHVAQRLDAAIARLRTALGS